MLLEAVSAAIVATHLIPTHDPVTEFVPPSPYLELAECESGSTPDIDTGNGYFGLYQFSPRSWRWVGGDEFAPMPHQATVEEQTIAAARLIDLQGWRAAFPACSRKLGLGEGG